MHEDFEITFASRQEGGRRISHVADTDIYGLLSASQEGGFLLRL